MRPGGEVAAWNTAECQQITLGTLKLIARPKRPGIFLGAVFLRPGGTPWQDY